MFSSYGLPRNKFIVLKSHPNKHKSVMHRSGIVFESDEPKIKPGMTVYYAVGHQIAEKNGVHYIAVKPGDVVFFGHPAN